MRGLLILAFGLGCSGGRGPAEAPAAVEIAQSKDASSGVETTPPPKSVEARERTFAYTTVDAPDVMNALVAGGADLSAMVSPAWMNAIERALTSKATAIARSDPKAGVGIRGNTHRLFNTRWLRDGRFELIGLTYRAERTPVRAERCGDVRLVYRLAYETEVSGQTVHSRLPMTLLVELEGAAKREGQCAEDAARWLSPRALKGEELAAFLLKGPLKDRLVPQSVRQVLINAQIVRWPSSVRPDLGGHAEYSMLAFAPNAARDALVPALLENMPDVSRIKKNSELRAGLLAWVAANLDGIDEGTALIPDRYLAKDALSVTPRGLSRLANRPFRQVFSASEFFGLDLSGRRHISSPEALLRRLDDLSCVGCHQSRTIAGFHWLGVDGPETKAGNALLVARSVPLLGDARRREEQTRVLASGGTPAFSRPPAERDDVDTGGLGARCGLGDPGFASWTCAAGLVCSPYDAPEGDTTVGVCVQEGVGAVGDTCQVSPLRQVADPHRDRALRASTRQCESGVCNINRTGFPGGMCTSSCGNLGDDGACGVIAQLTPFNNCLARNTPFPTCIENHVNPAGLRRCSADTPCRDDYVCAKTPSGEGGCMPPYFLFQLRVDGHP